MTITTITKEASEWGKAICDWEHIGTFEPLYTIKNRHGIYMTRSFSPGIIKDVKFFPPATKMTFIDGTVVTSVAQEGDEFSKEIGMMNCIMEYIFRGKSYNNMLRKWIKKDDKREKKKIAAELKAKEEAETKKRQAEKENGVRKLEQKEKKSVRLKSRKKLI